MYIQDSTSLQVIVISLKTLSPTYYTRIIEVMKRLNNAKRVLDVGCSDGYLDYMIKDRTEEICGIDINISDINIAKNHNHRNNYLLGGAYRIPFKDRHFDAVVCVDVLEHVKEDEEAIKEIVRVLKKNGKLIITVPSCKYPFTFDPLNYILRPFNKKIGIGVWYYGHKRLYDMDILSGILKKQGLRLIEKEYLSHGLIGIVENSYIANILQPLTKSDSKNKKRTAKNIERLKKRLTYKPPKLLSRVRDIFIQSDKKIFRQSDSSLGILIVAKKTS